MLLTLPYVFHTIPSWVLMKSCLFCLFVDFGNRRISFMLWFKSILFFPLVLASSKKSLKITLLTWKRRTGLHTLISGISSFHSIMFENLNYSSSTSTSTSFSPFYPKLKQQIRYSTSNPTNLHSKEMQHVNFRWTKSTYQQFPRLKIFFEKILL